MNKPYTALKISMEEVSSYLGNLLSALLGRKIICQTFYEEECYWSISAVNDRFSSTEIMQLILYVGGDHEMIQCNIPTESDTRRSLDVDLCNALLRRALNLEWKEEFLTEEAIWLIGDWPKPPTLPEPNSHLLFLNDREVDCRRLLPMNEFLDRLFTTGGNYSALTRLYEANEAIFGHPLYWVYPISDGAHNGCYLVLVREGVLAISYDEIDFENHEIFLRETARLCRAEDLGWFLSDWNRFVGDTRDVLNKLLNFLECTEALEKGEGSAI